MLAILVLALALTTSVAEGDLTLPYHGVISTDGKAFWVSNAYPGPGLTYGGFFYAAGIEGRGVFGQSDGSSGIGVKGWAKNTGDVENCGGHFTSAGERGIGVYGWAENTGDVRNYGGFFLADGNRGIGLFAMGGPGGLAGEFAGDIVITGAGNGIVFPDGTRQTTAGGGDSGSKTQYYAIPSCAFVPRRPSIDWYINNGWVGGETPGQPVRFLAPIHLPHGATLTQFIAVIDDKDPTQDISLHLIRQSPNGGAWGIGDTLSSSGTPGQVRIESPELAEDIDNLKHAWLVEAWWTTPSNPRDIHLFHVQICYTVGTATP